MLGTSTGTEELDVLALGTIVLGQNTKRRAEIEILFLTVIIVLYLGSYLPGR